MNIDLLPKQQELLDAIINEPPYTWIGYGGARGGGKSYAIRTIAYILGMSQTYATTSVIMRKQYRELDKNHIKPFLQEHPEVLANGCFVDKDKAVYDKPKREGGRAIIYFLALDKRSDLSKLQGLEFDLCFIDEAVHIADSSYFADITASLRDAKGGKLKKLVFTMNPGGNLHSYFNRIFIQRKLTEEEKVRNYRYIVSRVWDNYYLVQEDVRRCGYTKKDFIGWKEKQRRNFCLKESDYVKNALASLPETRKRQWLEGDWGAHSGLFFEEFDSEAHVVDPYKIPNHWALYGSIDPGFANPCSFGLTAFQPVSEGGKIVRVGTYYKSKLSAWEHAKNIWEFITSRNSPVYPYTGGRMPELTFAGRDAFAKKDKFSAIPNERTFSHPFMERGLYLNEVSRDAVSREPGWREWRTLMHAGRYNVFRGLNDELLDEIQDAPVDEKNPDDIAGRGNSRGVRDHALDEQRYVIMSVFQAPVGNRPVEPDNAYGLPVIDIMSGNARNKEEDSRIDWEVV